MTPKQAENLRVLIRHMETKCDRTLYMNSYFHRCGTPACALGEAASVPALAHCGIGRNTDEIHFFQAERAFGVGDRLFGLSSDNAFGKYHVTPQEWAAEARKVLAEHGYSMGDEKPIPSVRERLNAIYAGNVLEGFERDVAKLHARILGND